MTLLSDEFLIAYLDGQLERGQANGVTQMASANAEIARRLMRLKRTQAYFMETFGAFARAETIAPASPASYDERGPRGASAQAAAGVGTAEARYPAARTEAPPESETGLSRILFAAAVFLGGVVGGYGAHIVLSDRPAEQPKMLDRQLPSLQPMAVWTQDLAKFHAFFPRQTLTPHPDAISNSELIRFQLGKIANKAIIPPDFSKQGYSLFRGQAFTYYQDQMMQLTYSSKIEPPLTLYVLPAATAADSPIITHIFGNSKAVSWVDDKVRYFLISDKPEDDLKVLAVIAQSQIPRK